MDKRRITLPSFGKCIKLTNPDEEVCHALGQILAKPLPEVTCLSEVTCVIFENFLSSDLKKFQKSFLENADENITKPFDLTLEDEVVSIEDCFDLPLISLTIKFSDRYGFLREEEDLWRDLFIKNHFLSKLRISGAHDIPLGLWRALPNAKESLTSLVLANTKRPIQSQFKAGEVVKALDKLENLEELTLPAFYNEKDLEIFTKWFETKSKKGEKPLLPSVIIGGIQFPVVEAK